MDFLQEIIGLLLGMGAIFIKFELAVITWMQQGVREPIALAASLTYGNLIILFYFGLLNGVIGFFRLLWLAIKNTGVGRFFTNLIAPVRTSRFGTYWRTVNNNGNERIKKQSKKIIDWAVRERYWAFFILCIIPLIPVLEILAIVACRMSHSSNIGFWVIIAANTIKIFYTVKFIYLIGA